MPAPKPFTDAELAAGGFVPTQDERGIPSDAINPHRVPMRVSAADHARLPEILQAEYEADAHEDGTRTAKWVTRG